MARDRSILPAALVAQRVARVHGGYFRHWWKRNRALVAAAAACVAVVLGLWGYAELSTAESGVGGWADRTFDTIALFRFGGPDDELNWQLHVARLLAPLVVGYAFLHALVRLFREQAQLLRVRVVARRHVVVAGLGERGFMLATALHEARVSVVVVEVEAENQSVAGCRERGIPLIIGDARDPEVLAQARCDRALHVVCCCATDTANVDVLAACSVLAERPGWLPAIAHVLLENAALRTRLQILNLSTPRERGLRVDFASVSGLAGRALVGASNGVWHPAADRPATIIAAAGTPAGRQAALAALRVAAGAGAEPRLTLVGADAEEDRAALLAEAPWLGSEVSVVRWDPATPGGLPAALAHDVDVAFVCHPDGAAGLAQAIALSEHLDCSVVVDVGDERVADSMNLVGLGVRKLLPVGAAQRVLGPDLLLDTATEAIARARHDAYVRLELAAGRAGPGNPSLVSWDELPESLKDSNRRFADGVGANLAGLGGHLVEDGPAVSAGQPPTLPADTVEELARAEHERWSRDLIVDGWRRTDTRKDPSARLHPLLVPWEQLSEDERDKDRASIRDLPRIVAAAGYAIAFDRPRLAAKDLSSVGSEAPAGG